MPALPEDLAGHDCITLRQNNEDVSLWKFMRGKNQRSVRIEPVLVSNDGDVVRQWAMQSKGIMIRSEWDVADALKSGKLVHVLPDWELASADVVALCRSAKACRPGSRHSLPSSASVFPPRLRGDCDHG